MFYRVDYALAVMIAGLIAGALVSGITATTPASRLSHAYYAAVAALVAFRTAAFACSMLTSEQGFCTVASNVTGDLTSLAFASLFGVASRRRDPRELLVHPLSISALTLIIAFTFAMAAIGKVFSPIPMNEFFTQSGYSISFLKLIEMAEIFGAMGLLISWAFVPALIGLTVDMFGAVMTHIHNGDPLNDSTGAIALLIRLAAVGILWMLMPRANKRELSVRNATLRVGAVALICLVVAIFGSSTLRRVSPPASPVTAPVLH